MVIFVYLLILFKACEAVINLPENVSVPALIAFGDSLVDQGNNNHLITAAKADFLPYGKDLLIHGRPTGRFSNGKTVPDFLVEELGIKKLLPAYLDPNLEVQDLITGVSFGSGASGFDPITSNNTVPIPNLSLQDQTIMFKEYIGKLNTKIGRAKTSNILRNSLFIVVAGNNDFMLNYFAPITKRKGYNISEYTNLLISFASNFIQELYKLGARRIGVFGITKIGCIPLERTGGGGIFRKCSDKVNEAAQLFNQKLEAEIQSPVLQLPQAKVVFIDVYAFVEDIIQNPLKYGFENVDRGCCGSGLFEVGIFCEPFSKLCPDDSKHLFWDSCHPTETAYKILVNYIVHNYINKFF